MSVTHGISETPLVYTVDEVAEILRLGKSTIYKMVEEGKLPTVPLDMNRVLIPAHAIKALIQGEGAKQDEN